MSRSFKQDVEACIGKIRQEGAISPGALQYWVDLTVNHFAPVANAIPEVASDIVLTSDPERSGRKVFATKEWLAKRERK